MMKSETIEVLAYVRQAWPSLRIDPGDLPAAIDVWHDLIGDLDVAAVRAVLRDLAIRDDDFAPTPGQVRRAVVEAMAPGGRAPTTDAAWGEVQREISRVGCMAGVQVFGDCRDDVREPTFSHPAIAAVVEAMGWDSLCTSENEVADRAHFARMYADRVQRDVDNAASPAMVEGVRKLPAGKPVALAGVVKSIED